MKMDKVVVALLALATGVGFVAVSTDTVFAQPKNSHKPNKPFSAAPLTRVNSTNFQIGQVWSYKTRPQDTGSTYTVIKIDEKNGKKIVSVRIEGLHLKNPNSPGHMANAVGHVPIDADTLAHCSISLLRGGAPVPKESSDGYEAWKVAFNSGQGGFFTIPLAEVVQTVERALNKPAKGTTK